MPDIVNTRLRRLYEYWSGKRGDRRFPSRADIDPVDMVFALGNVILAEVLPETPPRFRIRLHGSALAQFVGYDLTGKMLDEMPVPEFRGPVAAQLRQGRARGRAVARARRPPGGRADAAL